MPGLRGTQTPDDHVQLLVRTTLSAQFVTTPSGIIARVVDNADGGSPVEGAVASLYVNDYARGYVSIGQACGSCALHATRLTLSVRPVGG
mgnify:CR=1 FL=1